MKEFKKLAEGAQTILITSHISPDADAICSSLLLYKTLKANFAGKSIALSLEEKPNADLSFLNGYSEVIFSPLAQKIDEVNPDLIIITDANTLSRCSRSNEISSRSKLVVIDHHLADGRDQAEIYINNGSPAATQDVYQLLFEELEMQKPDGYADIALLGILSDTFRFKYDNPLHRQTFAIVNDLLDAGASIEKLENRLARYTKPQMEILAQFSSNIIVTDQGCSYSWLDDDFTAHWIPINNVDDLKSGCDTFVNQYIRNIENNHWGFIVYPDIAAGPQRYAVSFRADDSKDVSVFARALGGGGHKPAAGAKFGAENAQAAINIVLAAIEKSHIS